MDYFVACIIQLYPHIQILTEKKQWIIRGPLSIKTYFSHLKVLKVICTCYRNKKRKMHFMNPKLGSINILKDSILYWCTSINMTDNIQTVQFHILICDLPLISKIITWFYKIKEFLFIFCFVLFAPKTQLKRILGKIWTPYLMKAKFIRSLLACSFNLDCERKPGLVLLT